MHTHTQQSKQSAQDYLAVVRARRAMGLRDDDSSKRTAKVTYTHTLDAPCAFETNPFDTPRLALFL